MGIKQLFAFVVLCLIALTMALPSPHEGFVDTQTLRDVGILYSEANFKGENTFVYEIKNTPECLPLDMSVESVIICKTDCYCNFYTGDNCEASPKNFAVTIGHGDVPKLETPQGTHFKHYSCGSGSPELSNLTITAAPHDAAHAAGM